MKLRRLLYECECGIISNSLDEYAKHAHGEMVPASQPDYGTSGGVLLTDEVIEKIHADVDVHDS